MNVCTSVLNPPPDAAAFISPLWSRGLWNERLHTCSSPDIKNSTRAVERTPASSVCLEFHHSTSQGTGLPRAVWKSLPCRGNTEPSQVWVLPRQDILLCFTLAMLLREMFVLINHSNWYHPFLHGEQTNSLPTLMHWVSYNYRSF